MRKERSSQMHIPSQLIPLYEVSTSLIIVSDYKFNNFYSVMLMSMTLIQF